MRQFILIILIIVVTLVITSAPKAKPVETLITLEQNWLADGHVGKADEMKDGRKCWRVEQFDFHGQQTWQAWRCTVLEGPLMGTIQWEWRNPIRR